jgi:hypothetical protein
MRRRELIELTATALFAWPLIARAQQQATSVRIGVLGFGPPLSPTRLEALRAGLRDLGYVEGKNLVIEFRWPGTAEQMHEAAGELARMKVDIHPADLFGRGRVGPTGDPHDPHRLHDPCRPRWPRTCVQSREARRKRNGIGRHGPRDHPEAE